MDDGCLPYPWESYGCVRSMRWPIKALAGAAVVVVAVDLFERRVLAGIDGASGDDGPDLAPWVTEPRWIDTPDGGHLYCEVRGDGSPILLLHGHGATLDTFTTLAPRLAAAGHRVIAVDQRGFGRSSAVPDGFDGFGLIDDVATVLEVLDLQESTVVGHSMGGLVALGMAIHRPDVTTRVQGLVLLNGIGRGPADNRFNRARVMAMDWPWLEALSRHPRHGTILTRSNFGMTPRRGDVEAARLVGLDSPIGPRRGFARRLLGTDFTPSLSTVRLPVLAIAGTADRVIPARESVLLRELLPDARMEILDGAGHMLPMERAATVAEMIVKFRGELDQRP